MEKVLLASTLELMKLDPAVVGVEGEVEVKEAATWGWLLPWGEEIQVHCHRPKSRKPAWWTSIAGGTFYWLGKILDQNIRNIQMFLFFANHFSCAKINHCSYSRV